jgi:hypothetical protein
MVRERISATILLSSDVVIRFMSPDTLPSSSLVLVIVFTSDYLDLTRLRAVMVCDSMLAVGIRGWQNRD